MKTFLVADTHFGHFGVCKFLNQYGNKLRPWDTPDEMDEDMVARWNDTVSPKDKVYHLGDVVINRRALKTLGRLNGRKVLIKGNHDIFRIQEYLEYFDDVRAYHILDEFVLSHIPLHPESVKRWKANVHGHLHSNRVMKDGQVDPTYYCVSVEHIDYRPIDFQAVKDYYK
jgi:calcineurin-like phosphoesterase family protein